MEQKYRIGDKVRTEHGEWIVIGVVHEGPEDDRRATYVCQHDDGAPWEWRRGVHREEEELEPRPDGE